MRKAVAVILSVLAWCGTASATDIAVDGREELLTALLSAKGGDRLLLAPGNYGRLELTAKSLPASGFDAPVTIASAVSGERAVIGGLSLRKVRHLNFEGLRFDYVSEPGQKVHFSPFLVRNSENIAFIDSEFDGDEERLADGSASGLSGGRGLDVLGSADIRISNNRVHGFHRGLVIGQSRHVVVEGNDVFALGSDGMDFAAVEGVIIANNHIHDFDLKTREKDHPDMIQFWTSGTAWPSTDIVIRDNVLDQAAGSWTQSLFMGNEAVRVNKAGREMFYRNVRIENNVIRNSHTHGITVGAAIGLEVVGNTLIQMLSIAEGDTVRTPAINMSERSEGVVIVDNVTPRLGLPKQGPKPDWKVAGNVIVQRDLPARPDHYRHVFVNAEAAGKVSLGDLRHLPDGPAAGVGAKRLAFDTNPPQPDGYIQQRTLGGRGLELVFDATHVFGPGGRLDLSAAAVAWDFGDGATGTGFEAAHAYRRTGRYEVSARITFADGSALDLRRAIVIPDA